MAKPVPAPYDVNFCFPVRELENKRIKLTPFIPALHADLFFRGSSSSADIYQHLPFGPYSSPSAFTGDLIYGRIQPDPGLMLYAIIDKTRSPADSNVIGPSGRPSSVDFAGTIGYLHGSPEQRSIEIGFIIILPPFRRTHVTTNAVGLLMRYALDPPTASLPGLGLRRVVWQSSEKNSASIRVAERMGFKMEARLRWDRVFPSGQGKVGNGGDIRAGDARPDMLGRHTILFATCWDEWENGGKERVARLMDR